jgi:hypothetical protein
MYCGPQTKAVRQRVQTSTAQPEGDAFYDLLTGPRLLERAESLLPPHRNRLFPPQKVLSMFCAQALSDDRSCQRAVDGAAVERLARDLPPCSTATGGYCRARKRLPTAVPTALARETAALVAESLPSHWLWQGRRAWLVDGTTLSMPDTLANQIRWPQPSTQAAGLGFPQCRLAGLICLSSGALGDAAIAPCEGKGSDEQTLLRKISAPLAPGDVLVGDAYFPTYFLLCWLVERGIDGVFEQYGARRRTTDFARGQPLGARDHLVVLPRPARPDWLEPADYARVPATLTVRELAAGGKILVTTLLCPGRYPKPAIAALYKRRWSVELDLRNIKTTLGMERLSCKSPAMVEKEIWVYLLAYNLIRLLMAQAGWLADQVPRQLSFKHAVQLWTLWLHYREALGTACDVAALLALMAQRRVGLRPRRIEPRALKRRPRNFPLLMQPRRLAREDARINGHPKKAK